MTLTKQTVGELIALCAANWPHQQDRDLAATAQLWLMGLGEVPVEVARAAVLKWVSSAKHWPTLADLREMVVEVQRADLPPAELAWDEVIRKVGRVGYTGSPSWSHASVGEAARALYGSWTALCQNLTAQSIPTDRAHFMRIYGAVTKRQREEHILPAAVRQMVAEAAPHLLGGGGSEADRVAHPVGRSSR